MRLPETNIKEAILHPELALRERAVRYFDRSKATDTSVMPLVIQAVEKYGKNDAYRLVGASREIAQTAETIDWVIEELNQKNSDQYESYTYNLSRVLLNADPTLLIPRESDILETQHFFPELRSSLRERLQMLSWDEATCWQKLESFCEEAKDKQQIKEVDLSYGERVVGALARYGTSSEHQVESLLREKILDYSHHPMKWMEPLLVRLAGQAQLESLTPLILDKLAEDCGDLGNEACSEALTQIGTPAVLEAVSEFYPYAPRHFQIYASDPLENVHSDLAVEKCLHLLGQEKDRSIQIILATALLSQFATEGIEATRELLIGHELDFETRGLRNQLVETCDIMEEQFPEYDVWKRNMKAEREEHQKRVKELGGDPVGLLKFAFEKMTGKSATTEAEPDTPTLPLPRKIAHQQKVGRNDPCLCGSGKKYKKCCLNK